MARHRDDDFFDIVTPTEHERRDADIARRRRLYFRIMIPCLALVLFGFFVPVWVPLRVGALAMAGALPPLAAIAANVRRP